MVSVWARSEMMNVTMRSFLALAIIGTTVSAFSPPKSPSLVHNKASSSSALFSKKIDDKQQIHRRTILSLIPVLVTASTASTPKSYAFDNRLDDKYKDVTPQTGTQPDYLGLDKRYSKTTKTDYTGLAPCPTSPNCWCSSTPFADNPSRYIAPWNSNGKTISDIKQVIDTHEVGQQNIDGGGFKIVTYDPQSQYLYVQFQSYKAGYIDDVEFWYNPTTNKFDVRSASRLGMSDLGVNGKRLNYIGTRLEKEFGWVLERRKNGSLV